MLNIRMRLGKLVAENKGFLVFLLSMIMVRSAVADWYGVPSASMYPTLVIGDRIITDRLAYDLKIPFTDIIAAHIADPRRGDIVTFTSPEDGLRLVKRIIGLPGDVVAMQNDELVINGVKAAYAAVGDGSVGRLSPDYRGRQLVLSERILGSERPILVMPDRKALRSFDPVTIPAGKYLVLGDNRDNSKDSRYIGFVSRELLTGQVRRVAFSLDADRYYLPRIERFGVPLL